jgi:transcriptional regulator with XRE-family HTH domain
MFRESPSETFPDNVVEALLSGSHPLRVFREHRGLTQAGLARATGTSAVYISQLERGARRIGRKLRAKLATVLKVEPDILDRDGG